MTLQPAQHLPDPTRRILPGRLMAVTAAQPTDDQCQVRLRQQVASLLFLTRLSFQQIDPLHDLREFLLRQPKMTWEGRSTLAFSSFRKEKVKTGEPAQLLPQPGNDIPTEQYVDQIQAARVSIPVFARGGDDEDVARFHPMTEPLGHMNRAPGKNHRDFVKVMAMLRDIRLPRLSPDMHPDLAVGKEIITAKLAICHGRILKLYGRIFEVF